MPSNPKPGNRFFAWATAVCFGMILSAPLADSIFGLSPDASLGENRKLTGFPEPPSDLKSISAWPKNFEAYYNDNFGFRSQLVRGNNYFQVFLLGSFPARHVTVGRSGWLYLPFDGFTDDYGRVAEFDKSIVEYWNTELARRKRLCDSLGIQYVVLIAPNKQSIYPEFLPERQLKSWDPTIFDRFLKVLPTDISVVDLRDVLRRAKASELVYMKTDSHWNDRGAFIAVNECIRHLQEWQPSLKLLDRKKYQEVVATDCEGGDLARLLAFQDRLREDSITLKPAQASKVVPAACAFTPKDGAAKGQMPQTFENSNPELDVRVVITGDSFLPSLMPFLGESFRRVAGYRLTFPYSEEHSEFTEAMLKAERPNVYIEQFVERAVGRRR